MKISIDWLKEYIDVDLSFTEIIDRLNAIGMLVESWEERGNDVILDVDTYANRPDTLGHLGMARELGAALGQPLQEKSWPVIEAEEEISDCFNIQIMDDDLCPRYCGVLIRDVKVGPSPQWLQDRLVSVGLNPINNIVDVTNYVLLSTAQPIHSFDVAKLEGAEIIVRRAKKGETLRTLEGKDVSLSPEMLVIADSKKPVALAGVIGGEESGVTEATRDVLIESAYFDPVSVRKTWKQAGVQTDASYRFERGADVSFPPVAAKMAASLITQMGGKALKGILDIYPKPSRPRTVVLRHHRIAELLGIDVKKKSVEKMLSQNEFKLEMQQPGTWQVQVPSYRVDIEREADLIEEIARFYGYENIPARLPPMEAMDVGEDGNRAQQEHLRSVLLHEGFDEVVNLSFFGPEQAEQFKSSHKAIEIRNPVSSRASLLKTTLLSGLLENIVWNKNRGAEGVHIFEVGNIFYWNETGHTEKLSLALATWGILGSPHWQRKTERTDFFHLKGACGTLLMHLRYQPIAFQETDHPYFESSSVLSLAVKGTECGILGLLKSEILGAYDFTESVWAAEIDLAALFELQPQVFKYTPVIKFPSIVRDISFFIDQDVSYQEIEETIQGLDIRYLEEFGLYDRYIGASVPKGKTSLSLRLTFRHPEKTLLAEEVDEFQQKIMKALQAGFQLQFREGGGN